MDDIRVRIGRRGFLAAGAGAVALTAVGAAAPAAAEEIGPVDPGRRATEAYRVRMRAAQAERRRPRVDHPVNGDEQAYPTRIGSHTKGLPHDDLGEVDPAAYAALLAALEAGDSAALDRVPLGTEGRVKFTNPLGGLAFDLSGPDSRAVAVRTPPAFASAETAAELVDQYWIALCRDIPFDAWATDPTIAAAAEDLSRLVDYAGPRDGGRVTPATIFRLPYPGCSDGPYTSQFLLQPYRFNGIAVQQRVRVPEAGQDFLTRYPDWLSRLRGGAPVGTIRFDATARHYRNLRDIGQGALQDAIYSPYFAAALILLGYGANAVDEANPYLTSPTQSGSVTFGTPHLLGLLSGVVQFERHSYYQKWQVHRRIRPDYYSGRVHNHLTGAAQYPLHPQLLASSVLDRVAAANRARTGDATWLLPVMTPDGSPSSPGYLSGHATTAGACTTLLKAWFREDFPIPDPVKPNADGTALVPYVAGVDGPQLTVGGELNKLAQAIAYGRGVTGAHFRSDTADGVLTGEEIAIRTLQEERTGLVESGVRFSLTRFDGSRVQV